MHICQVCEQQVEDGNYRDVEIVVGTQIYLVTICIWCAQLIKETFEEK